MLLITFLIIVSAVDLQAGDIDRGRVGKSIIIPAGYSSVDHHDLVLTGEPIVTMTDTYKAVVSFETLSPCPAATVYFGVYEPDAELPLPRFRTSNSEKLDGYRRKHEVKLKLKKLTEEGIDVTGLGENKSGVIAYRIEVYDPEQARSFFIDRRFAFKNGRIVPVVIEGPFIDQVTPTGAIISWDSDLASGGFVNVDGRIINPDGNSLKTHFEITVRQLKPASNHDYKIALVHNADTTFSRYYRFRTPPVENRCVKFAVLGDSQSDRGGGERDRCGVNARVMNQLALDAYNQKVDFIIQLGDQVDGFTTSPVDMWMQLRSYKYAIEPVAHYIPFYEVFGNHNLLIDYFKGDKRKLRCDKLGALNSETIFAEAFVNPVNAPDPEADNAPDYDETAYYFDYGNCRFLVLNTEYWHIDDPEMHGGNLQGYILDNQLKWIKSVFSDAAENPDIEHLFLCAHEPFFPNGPHADDALWYNGGDPAENNGTDRTYVVHRRDEIWGDFVGTGKAVCGLFGHEHCYNRTRITDKICPDYSQPAWQIISGGGGPYYAQIKDVPWAEAVEAFSMQNHFLVIAVEGSKATLEAHSISGELIDRMVLTE